MVIVEELREGDELLGEELVGHVHCCVHDTGTMGSDRVCHVPDVDRIQVLVDTTTG